MLKITALEIMQCISTEIYSPSYDIWACIPPGGESSRILKLGVLLGMCGESHSQCHSKERKPTQPSHVSIVRSCINFFYGVCNRHYFIFRMAEMPLHCLDSIVERAQAAHVIPHVCWFAIVMEIYGKLWLAEVECEKHKVERIEIGKKGDV